MMEPCDCGAIDCPICGVIWDDENKAWIGKPQQEEGYGKERSECEKQLINLFYQILERENEHEH